MAGSSPARFEVLLTDGAEQDLEAIHDYVVEYDSPAKAGNVLDRLMAVLDGLARFPGRGSYPKELLALGIKDYRQTSFKPYRIIHRVMDRRVMIYLIVDGRRDMQAVLHAVSSAGSCPVRLTGRQGRLYGSIRASSSA